MNINHLETDGFDNKSLQKGTSIYRMDKQSNTNHLFCVEYIILIYIILSYLGYFRFCTL